MDRWWKTLGLLSVLPACSGPGTEQTPLEAPRTVVRAPEAEPNTQPEAPRVTPGNPAAPTFRAPRLASPVPGAPQPDPSEAAPSPSTKRAATRSWATPTNTA